MKNINCFVVDLYKEVLIMSKISHLFAQKDDLNLKLIDGKHLIN